MRTFLVLFTLIFFFAVTLTANAGSHQEIGQQTVFPEWVPVTGYEGIFVAFTGEKIERAEQSTLYEIFVMYENGEIFKANIGLEGDPTTDGVYFITNQTWTHVHVLIGPKGPTIVIKIVDK